MKNGAHELPLIIIFSISLHAILAYILRDFLRCELNIDYYIEFGNVHRFGSRQNNTNGTEIRPRPIVARFLYYNDLAYGLECAKRLRGKPYGINQQFPAEIENRRRSLYPVMKEAKTEENG